MKWTLEITKRNFWKPLVVGALLFLCFFAGLTVNVGLIYPTIYNDVQPKAYKEGYEKALGDIQQLLSRNDIYFDWQDLGNGLYNFRILNATTGMELSASTKIRREIHATIEMWKDGKKVFEYSHPGSMTKLGLNFTLAKLSGNSTAYNMTQYNLNNTYISIGNQGVLTTDSTELPGEWNRTSAVQHDCVYNSFNVTAWFYPDAGPYTADCIGVNFEDGISNGALFCYDTFTEVTGIDASYKIRVEFQISVS